MVDVQLPPQQENIVKKWHDGKTTYAASAPTLVVVLGGLFGISFTDQLPVEIARFGETIEYILVGVFALLAAYGRAKAITAGFIGKKRLQK